MAVRVGKNKCAARIQKNFNESEAAGIEVIKRYLAPITGFVQVSNGDWGETVTWKAFLKLATPQ